MLNPKRAFTLIELLIVVAIIAILAAIAVPNFIEAQTRAKISKAKADMRSLATALESYQVDWNHYPLSYSIGNNFYADHLTMCLYVITTPVAYMSSVTLPDPFGEKERVLQAQTASRPLYMFHNYEMLLPYESDGKGTAPGLSVEWAWDFVKNHGLGLQASHRAYILQSPGPDRNTDGLYTCDWDPENPIYIQRCIYDPTNGTTSSGDIGRLGGNYRFKHPLG